MTLSDPCEEAASVGTPFVMPHYFLDVRYIVPAKKESRLRLHTVSGPSCLGRNYCTLGETRRLRCDGRHELNNILGKPRSAANKQKL